MILLSAPLPLFALALLPPGVSFMNFSILFYIYASASASGVPTIYPSTWAIKKKIMDTIRSIGMQQSKA